MKIVGGVVFSRRVYCLRHTLQEQHKVAGMVKTLQEHLLTPFTRVPTSAAFHCAVANCSSGRGESLFGAWICLLVIRVTIYHLRSTFLAGGQERGGGGVGRNSSLLFPCPRSVRFTDELNFSSESRLRERRRRRGFVCLNETGHLPESDDVHGIGRLLRYLSTQHQHLNVNVLLLDALSASASALPFFVNF